MWNIFLYIFPTAISRDNVSAPSVIRFHLFFFFLLPSIYIQKTYKITFEFRVEVLSHLSNFKNIFKKTWNMSNKWKKRNIERKCTYKNDLPNTQRKTKIHHLKWLIALSVKHTMEENICMHIKCCCFC